MWKTTIPMLAALGLVAVAPQAPAEASFPLLAQSTGQVAITGVTPSSTRNSAFPASHILDGNTSSAWAPGAGDAAPTLTLKLAPNSTFASMAIKMEPATVRVDVAVLSADGWRTIASNLAPRATVLDRLNLPTSAVSQVRLTFRGTNVAALQVCEVQFFASPVSGAPTVPLPVPTASVPPVSGLDCVRVSGGGWIATPGEGQHKGHGKGHEKGHEKGHGKGHEKGRGKGHEKHHDKQGRVKFTVENHVVSVHDTARNVKYQGRIQRMQRQGNTVTFAGTLTTGAAFSGRVEDRAKGDRFGFATSGYELVGTLGGGNLKVRQGDCD